MTVTYRGATEETNRIVHHHAVLRRGLEQRVGALCAATAEPGSERAMAELQDYLAEEILPHAAAEERTLYQAAATWARGSRLVRTLTAEHRELAGLVSRLQSTPDPATAADVAEWIATLFAGHVAKENDQLLPALVGSGSDLGALLADMGHLTGRA